MKEQFNVMKMINLSLVLGIGFAYFFIGDLQSLNFLNFEQIDSSDSIILLVPVSAILLGNYLFKNNLQNVNKNLKNHQKVGAYQTASIIRWAILEGAAFFILFYKSQFILLGLLLILYILFLRPSEHKMIEDFKKYER